MLGCGVLNARVNGTLPQGFAGKPCQLWLLNEPVIGVAAGKEKRRTDCKPDCRAVRPSPPLPGCKLRPFYNVWELVKETVVVLGASANPQRYSNRAVRMLRDRGHEVIPVHPALDSVEGIPALPSLDGIQVPVDTVTVYVSPQHSKPMIESLKALQPERVIFNPGAESPKVEAALTAAGVRCVKACTLVLLGTGQFASAGRDGLP